MVRFQEMNEITNILELEVIWFLCIIIVYFLKLEIINAFNIIIKTNLFILF